MLKLPDWLNKKALLQFFLLCFGFLIGLILLKVVPKLMLPILALAATLMWVRKFRKKKPSTEQLTQQPQ